jgi:hypothetical protein
MIKTLRQDARIDNKKKKKRSVDMAWQYGKDIHAYMEMNGRILIYNTIHSFAVT